MTEYEPLLSWKAPFSRSSGKSTEISNEQVIVRDAPVETSFWGGMMTFFRGRGSNHVTRSEKRKVRMFVGQNGNDNTEEMIYVATEYCLAAKQIRMESDEYIDKFLMVVETSEREVLNEIIMEKSAKGFVYQPGEEGLRELVKQWTV